MKILVCIGSACHVRGSYKVKEALEQLVAQSGLQEQASIGVSICLGHCEAGVTIKVDEQIVTGVTVDNVNAIFEQYIKKAV